MLTPFQKAPGDVSNFDTEFTKEQPTLTPVHGQLTAKDQMEFNGFSWVRYICLHDMIPGSLIKIQVAAWADAV